MDLRPAGKKGFGGVLFGGACGAAAAVTAGPSAHQDNGIARGRIFPQHVFAGDGADNGTEFHSLGQKTFVVQLRHLSRSQANLVPIGTVAGRRSGRYLALGQFAGKSVFNRCPGVGTACNTHGLVNVSSSGKGVSNSPSQTGSRAAERLYLGRMVMRFVLEHNQPFFLLAADISFDHNAAGIDLLRFIQVVQEPSFLQLLHTHQGNIHQANIFFFLPGAVNIVPGSLVFPERFLDRAAETARGNVRFFNFGVKGCMTAVV